MSFAKKTFNSPLHFERHFWSVVLICAAALSNVCYSQTATQDGGSSGNGGGGIYSPSQVGWTALVPLRQFKKKSYVQEISDAQKVWPKLNYFTICPKSHPEMAIPDVASLQKYFEMRVEDSSGGVIPLEKSKICGSPELIASYGRFFMALVDEGALNSSQDGHFTRELLRRTYAHGGKIPVVITDHDFKLNTVTGYSPTDSSIYDSNTRQIYWHSAAQNQVEVPPGADLTTTLTIWGNEAIQRKPMALLRHEVTHLLLQRVLGDFYPVTGERHYGRIPRGENCDKCKNLSPGEQCQCRPTGDSATLYYTWNTDYISSLIEGICDWSEQGHDGVTHPYAINGIVQANTYGLAVDSKSKDQICFNNVGKFPVKLESLTSNEAHVNSALRMFNTEMVPDPDHPGTRILKLNYEQMLSMLTAIETGPRNISQLAKAIDQIRGGNEGLHWLRKYFAFDYEDTLAIKKSLTTYSKTPQGYIIGDGLIYFSSCLSPKDSQFWFPEKFNSESH